MSLDMDLYVLEAAFDAFGLEATHRSDASGDETPILVIPARPDQITIFGETRLKGYQNLFEVRASQLPDPQEEDEIDFKSTTYVVKTAITKDADRLIWVLECVPL